MTSRFFHRAAALFAVMTMVSLAWAAPAAVRGDVLILSNGDHLTGKLVKHADGKFYFRSDILGNIVAPDDSASVVLSGDRLTGKVVKRSDGKILFHSDIIGDVIAPANAFTIVKPHLPSTPVESLVGLPPVKPAPKPQAAASGPPPPPTVTVVVAPTVTPWSGKIEFGYDNVVSNDVRTVGTTLRAEAERNIGKDNLLFKDRFLYGSSGGVATTDEENGDFRWRHNLSDLLFTQTDSSYDTDKIALIHYELQQDAGLGYKIFKSPRQVVDVGAGVTGEDLDATGVQKGFTYLGNVFQDYTYKINGRYTFLENLTAQYSPESRALSGLVPDTIVPVTGDQRDYAYGFHTTLQGKISNHLSLNLHFEYQYNNAVLIPSSRPEQRVTTTLGYGF